jgi:hypothetical protein
MDPFHSLLSGNSFRHYGINLRDINKTESTASILTMVIFDLCPTKRTRAVKIHARFRKLWLHVTLLKIDRLVDQQGSFTDVSPIPILQRRDLLTSDQHMLPFRDLELSGTNLVAS